MTENSAVPSEDLTACRRRHSEYYLTRLRRIESQYRQGGRFILEALVGFDEDLGQIRQGRSWPSEKIGKEAWAAGLSLGYSLAGASILSWRLSPSERVEWLRSGLRAAQATEDLESEADLWEELGNTRGRAREWKKAIDDYWGSWKLSRTLADRQREGRALGNLGLAYAALGDREEARRALAQALEIAQETRDRFAEGRHQGSLGLASDGEEAIECFSSALEIAREIGDRHGEISHLGCLGMAWLRKGELAGNTPYPLSLHPNILMRNMRPDGSLPQHLQEKLTALSPAASFEKARTYLEEALSTAREIGDRPAEARHLGNLGSVLLAQGELGQAVEHLEDALRLSRETGWVEDELRQLENLRSAYLSLGDREGARKVEQELEEIHRSLGEHRREELAGVHGRSDHPSPYDGEYLKVSADEDRKRYWSEYYAIHIGE